jgi:hypothetical protein
MPLTSDRRVSVYKLPLRKSQAKRTAAVGIDWRECLYQHPMQAALVLKAVNGDIDKAMEKLLNDDADLRDVGKE